MLVWLRVLADRIAGRAVWSAEGETTPKRKAALRKPEPPIDQIGELTRIVGQATDEEISARTSCNSTDHGVTVWDDDGERGHRPIALCAGVGGSGDRACLLSY
jgi:hypothetical protein